MPSILTIAGYRFTPLDRLETWRDQLKPLCIEHHLKGTILLAPEGINFCLAGTRQQLDPVLSQIRSIPGLADLQPKESSCSRQPFQRLLVKIKKEIVPFGVPGVDPSRHPTPKLSAKELKKWLDHKRPFTLLDTRNDYEIRLGTFQGALNPHISNFRDFPEAVDKLNPELKSQPVVGGILKYFEEVGGDHFQGECFVFDERVGVDTKLQETDSVLCYNCQMPLLPSDLSHPHYQYEKSCHFCFYGKPQKGGPKADTTG